MESVFVPVAKFFTFIEVYCCNMIVVTWGWDRGGLPSWSGPTHGVGTAIGDEALTQPADSHQHASIARGGFGYGRL